MSPSSLTAPPIFASTARLNIRGPTEDDLNRLVALWATPTNQRTNPGSVIPWGLSQTKKAEDAMRDMVFIGILDAKVPHEDDVKSAGVGLGGASQAKEEGNASESTKPDLFVGAVMLMDRYAPKNRDTMFGIQLVQRWWGRGLAKEATIWLLDHTFEQLNMHRVSLHVMGDNSRAIDLYKSVGFQDEGRRRKAVWQDGRYMDDVNMGILHEEWTELKAQRQVQS